MYLAVLHALCMLIVGSSAYKTVRTYYFNGKVYKEVNEQPWFRVVHRTHTPIPAPMVNESGFGQHDLPEDDIYVEHDWTEEEKKYLPCLDLLCVCPYYGGERILSCHVRTRQVAGKVSGSKCVLPNGKLLQKAIRKEARQLSDSERFQIAIAFNKMKSAGLYDRIGFVHKYSGLHEGPGFFTWHREYLKRFELVFRRFLPPGSRLGLPYWDSTMESELPDPRESLFFSSLFVGAANATGQIIDGPFSDWNIMEELEPLTHKDAISNKYTDNMYEYSKRSTCSEAKWDCGSKYLFCHRVDGNPQCVAKLRIGAICQGFEDTPICYEGRCVDGRCVRKDLDVGPDPKDFM
ncbi:hypothetical protein ANCDUO_01467 [Ancylostoma duodenale]|uniref:Tyrosinase copper-binding domain-containing protein n=1 Tax=Ancylostoma duodenale TaxID=51022 RepID=A0A0C2DYT4_9BILA|nr:hypothetical protein ANCDUO_01467 [Ancylostoma duodenale]